MRALRLVAALVASIGFLASGHAAAAQQSAKVSPGEMLAALKVGQWVKVKGPVQQNHSVICTDAKMLTGDFLDDDWEVAGVVRRVDPMKRVVMIHHMLVRPREKAEFESAAGPHGSFRSFADIKVGMFLEVEGTYLKDGTVLGEQFEDKSQKLVQRPNLDREIQMEGKIEKIDMAKRELTVMGTTFVFNDGTKIKSMIK